MRSPRDARIDIFRGVALIFIFIDHIPNNSWAYATLRNFGFADASEVFVLLAGYSAALSYGLGQRSMTFPAALRRAGRRALQIYFWHIGIFLASAVLLYSAARVFDRPDYIYNIALQNLASDPWRALLEALALVYQPNQLNILPLYVVLMVWLPFLLALMKRSVALALTVSFAIWTVTNASGINLPANSPGEGWYFNPLAWQLLFTTGAAAAVLAQQKRQLLRFELLLMAAAYVLFAFLNAAPWVPITWLPNEPLLPPDIVGHVSKGYLSGWRYLHILALAYLTASLVKAESPWLRHPVATALEACGRHSLQVFGLGTLLSFAAWIVMNELGTTRAIEIFVNVGGVAALAACAALLSARKLEQSARFPAVASNEPSWPARQ